MLERLDGIQWAELNHAYGTAEDVPALLRDLLDPDPEVRSRLTRALYGNIFHQGTRYPATPYVVPFLIELCSSSETPERAILLHLWKSLITGYFTVSERPVWGDGVYVHCYDGTTECAEDDPYAEALHRIYRESLEGHELLLALLRDAEVTVRAGAAGVLACLPTVGDASVSALKAALNEEPDGGVRAAIAFALGELGSVEPLRRILAEDVSPAARCMAVCELARIAPEASLLESLLRFIAEPIDGYDAVPGAGGNSTGDAAHAVSYLPADLKLQSIPAFGQLLKQSQSFETMTPVRSLLSIGFQRSSEPVAVIDHIQRDILGRFVECPGIWRIDMLSSDFQAYGLPFDRRKCAALSGVEFRDGRVSTALRKLCRLLTGA